MALRTVLVVEDCESEAQRLEQSLRDAISPNAVVLVSTTLEAERLLFADAAPGGTKRATPDLVVFDAGRAPCGLEFLKKVRAHQRTRSIPVVFLSGEMRDSDVRDLYRSGANSYLDKPGDFQAFVDVVSTTTRYWLGLNMNARPAR